MLQKEWTGSSSKSTDIVSYLTERLEKASAAATHMETAAKESMKTYYDKGTRCQLFQVGDLVLILKPSTKVKLHAQWQGPYSIVTRLSDTTYTVRKLNSMQRKDEATTPTSERGGSPHPLCACWQSHLRRWKIYPHGRCTPRREKSQSDQRYPRRRGNS